MDWAIKPPPCLVVSVHVFPVLVLPTELTDYTEAYGLNFLEFTERIDATRHTTESTEMIDCNK